MNIEKKNNNIYTKELDTMDAYLLNIIKRFFQNDVETINNSAEAIILEAVTRAKKEIRLDGRYGVSSINDRSGAVTITAGDIGAEPVILEKHTAFNKDFGTEEDTVCEGNDPRLSDARVPLEHTHSEYALEESIMPFLLTDAMIEKLDGIEEGANKYIHPANHPASMITTDLTHQFVTATDKTRWDDKADKTLATPTNDGLMSKEYAQKLEDLESVVEDIPTPYTHPTGEGYEHIPTGGALTNILGWDSSGKAKWVDYGTVADYTKLGNKPVGNDGQVYYIEGNSSSTVKPAYILYKASMIETDDELTNAKFTLVDTSVIFNSWYRFSHDAGTTQPASLSETTNWNYDSVNKRIVCGTNSNTYIGFISPEKYDEYNLEVTLSSADTDNDAIAIVIAFTKDTAGREHTLSVVRSRGYDSHVLVQGYSYQYTLVYNYCMADEKLIDYRSIGSDTLGAWSSIAGVRIKVMRSGDSITTYTSSMSDLVINTNYSLHVDLNSDPVLQKFKGPQQYGYACISQLNATFSDILFDKDNKYIYDSRTDQTWYVTAGGTWTIDTTKLASDELGTGKFVFNETTNKLFYINGRNDIVSVMNEYMRKDEMDNYLRAKGLIS